MPSRVISQSRNEILGVSKVTQIFNLELVDSMGKAVVKGNGEVVDVGNGQVRLS